MRRELPPLQIVLTKCDLVKQADLARRVVAVKRDLPDFLLREPVPPARRLYLEGAGGST